MRRMEKRIGLGARSVVVWAPEGACGQVPLVVMPVFRGDGSEVWRRCRELECPAFSLVSIGGVAWERDMTPWALAARASPPWRATPGSPTT